LRKHAGNNLVLQDIHLLDQYDNLPEKEELLARLHVRTVDGKWLRGIEANVRAWEHTRYAPLWRVLNWPIIRVFSSAAYEIWLQLRKRKETGPTH